MPYPLALLAPASEKTAHFKHCEFSDSAEGLRHINAETSQIVAKELERIKNDPALCKLFLSRDNV